MKIRTGFVSNSSSSSFVLVVGEKLHNEIMDLIESENTRCVLESMGEFKEINGKCFLLKGIQWEGGMGEGEEEEERIENLFEIFNQYKKLLAGHKDYVLVEESW